MTRIRIAKTVDSLLKGADALLIVAPKARLDDGSFLDCLPEPVMRFALDLASDLEPGLTGLAAGTLTGDSPRKVAVGVALDDRQAAGDGLVDAFLRQFDTACINVLFFRQLHQKGAVAATDVKDAGA